MSEEGLNPFRKSSRTERSPSRSEERNQSKEIEKKIKTVLREKHGSMKLIFFGNSANRRLDNAYSSCHFALLHM
jgi:hypothetical protein